jgi:hypothetical protein
VAHLWGGVVFKGLLGWMFRMAADVKYFLSIMSPIKSFKLYLEEMTVFLKND